VSAISSAVSPGQKSTVTPVPVCPACGGSLDRPLGTKNGYALRRCSTCRSASVVPLPTHAELEAHYASYYNTPNYMRKRESKLQQAKRRLARIRGISGARTFLDVGCNAGFAVAAARAMGLDAHGIDIDADAVAAAQAAFGREHYEVATIEAYAASGQTVDILYTSEVIEHTPQPETFAAAMARIVRPGGRILLTTPAADHWAVPRDFSAWEEAKPPIHLILYSREGLRRLLGRHGFGSFRFEFKLKPRITLHAQRLG
jgi:SAM-dependent methyltransferase